MRPLGSPKEHAVVPGETTDYSWRMEDIQSAAKRHHAELLRMLSARLPNVVDAQDLAQEAYARLLRYSGRLKEEDLRRMLFRIALNLLTDHYRWSRLRQSAQSSVEDLGYEVFSDEPGQDRWLEGMQSLRAIEKLVMAMPSRRRTIFLLSRVEELSNAEIAKRCGVSLKAVEKHLSKALAECRKFAKNGELCGKS